jgi:hypothetical protein
MLKVLFSSRRKEIEVWRAISCIFLLLTSDYNGQIFTLGIKAHPAIGITYKSSRSSMDPQIFKPKPFVPQFQLGLVSAIDFKNLMVSFALHTGSRKAELRFIQEEDFLSVSYKLATLFTRLSVGKTVAQSKRLRWKIYALASVGIDLSFLSNQSGSGEIYSANFVKYEAHLPPVSYTASHPSAGVSLRLRSINKLLGLYEMGFTFDHAFHLFHTVTLQAEYISKTYYGSLTPRFSFVSIDFIKYFSIRTYDNGWKKIKATELGGLN